MGGILKMLGALLGKKPEQEIVLRGFLGISLEEKAEYVVVAGVLGKSPAEDAGLRPGDRITKFQGKTVSSIAAINRAAAKLGPDQTAKLEIERDGKSKTIEIKSGRGM